MSLADKASLLLIPTGYKSQKVYSIFPTDGVGDFDFSRSSSATRIAKNGLITTVAANVPRLEYPMIDGVVSGCPSLLLEPQRTNLIAYSEDFNTWSKEATVTLTSNYGISPNGTQNSTRVQMDIDDSIYISATSGNNFSIYIKGVQDETIRIVNGGSLTHTLTGKWDRISIYDTGNSSSLISINTYSGATVRDIEIWGAQLEQGSYATSYIPTSGSAVTRIADVCNNGGNDQVINSTEGVFYVEIEGFENDNVNRYISLCDSSSSNAIRIFYYSDGGTVFFRKNVNTVGVITSSTTVINQSELAKIAIRYNSTSFDIFSNGVKILTNSNSDTFSNNTLNTINFTDSNGFSSPFLGNVKDLKVYNTTLSDSELTALTTI